jgi:hypothetical protein
MLPALFAGCGGDDGGTSEDVQALRIEQFQQDIRIWCTTGVGDPAGAADPLGTMLTAVDELIKIYKDEPDATYKIARISKLGDKGPLVERPIKDLIVQSSRLLQRCGKYGRDQAARLQQTISA